jgi:hypothetical protein
MCPPISQRGEILAALNSELAFLLSYVRGTYEKAAGSGGLQTSYCFRASLYG